MKINNPATLNFNPLQSRQELRDVFSDYVARTLWIGVRQGHIIDQFFETYCVRAANHIKQEMPQSPKQLREILRQFGLIGLNDDKEEEFSTELLSYISGEKALAYKVPESRPNSPTLQYLLSSPL